MKNIITQILATFNIKVSVTEVSNGLILGNLVMLEVFESHIDGKQEFRIGTLTKESIIEGNYEITDNQKVTRSTNPKAAANFAILMLMSKFVHDQVEFEYQNNKPFTTTRGNPTFTKNKPVEPSTIN